MLSILAAIVVIAKAKQKGWDSIYLKAYLDASGQPGKPKLPLFPTLDRSSERLTDTPLSRRNALEM